MAFWRLKMTSYQIPYGTNQLTFEIPDNEHVELIEPPLITTPLDPIEEIHEALRNSIGRGLPKKGSKSKIAVVVNDKTRPVPNKILIPLLVDELRKLGYSIKDIQFFIASGIHLPLTQDEINCLLPEEILQNCVCVSHDCDDFLNLVDLGFSKRRTPITINKKFYESDVKILVGNIEPHHFAGFSGGYKTAVIGLGGRKTINHNHSLLMDPLSSFG
jgi:nickel-dependent lactate racemase